MSDDAMTKERAKQMWDEWKWWIAVIVLPLTILAAKTYDAKKLDERVFADYVNAQMARDAMRDVRDSSRQEQIGRQLRYLICREDFSRQQCLRPDR